MQFFYEQEEQHMKKSIALLATLALVAANTSCASEPTWSAQKLVVGMECGYAPFNWTDPSANETNVKITGGDGYCDGYDVQVARALAESLNVPIEIRKINWEGLVTALQAGSIDVILAGMSPTAERMEQIAFSSDYFNSEQVVVVRTDSPYADADALADFAGATLVSQLGTIQDRLIAESAETYDLTHGTAYLTYPAAFIAVAENSAIDGVVAEYPVARAVVNNNPQLTMVHFAPGQGFDVNDEDVLVSVGVRKGDTLLLGRINTFLASFDETTRGEWMDDVIARQPS
jgi:ABC-type amino acid transport substrate-binding protein